MNFFESFSNPFRHNFGFSMPYLGELGRRETPEPKDVKDIPLSERLAKLMENETYKKIFNALEAEELKKAKKLAQKIWEEIGEKISGSSSEKLPTGEELLEICQLKVSRNVADLLLKACFSDEEMDTSAKHLFDRSKPLSKNNHDMIQIAIWLRRKDSEMTDYLFGPRKKVFQTFLARNLTDFANSIGHTIMEDPRAILRYGIRCFDEQEDPDYSFIARQADAWVKRFLEPKRMKLLLSEKTVKSSIPNSRIHKEAIRYQNSFKETLLDYLKNAPSYVQNVFNVLIPYMDKMEIRMQEKIWESLFQKLDGNPQTQKDAVAHISRFLEHSNSDTAKKTFYSCFIKNVPQDLRAEILGQFSPKILTKYWNNFHHSEKSFIHSKVKTKLGNEYLLWYMFRQGKISNDELFAKLKKLNLEKYRSVIFADKKDMDTSLFIRMASYLAPSKNYFWRWVISFRNIPEFEHELASIYPLLPKEIKDNQLYVVAMNNHFNLIQQCAFNEDTSSLTNLKKILGKNSFWHSLTKGNNSGFRFLCKREKRWVLKSLSDLPLEQQQLLFTTPNEEGKTVLDVCPENFRRMVDENIFNNVRVKSKTSEEKREPKKQEESEMLSPSNFVDENKEKAPFPRHIIRLQSFKDDLERFDTNPDLQKDVEEAIEILSTMSKKRMQLELRESFKNHHKLNRTPCFVRNIRGNNYRLGYCVQGDVDKNEGKIAFLFFWSHEEYNNKLWDSTEFLVKQAHLLMEQTPNVPPVPPIPPIPSNTGNSGR